jgi:hypothetical protein
LSRHIHEKIREVPRATDRDAGSAREWRSANSETIERDDGALRKLLEQLESARDENYSMRKEMERSKTSYPTIRGVMLTK